MDKSGYLDVLYRRMGYFAFTLCVIYITIGFYTPRDAVLYMYKTPGSDATTGGGRYTRGTSYVNQPNLTKRRLERCHSSHPASPLDRSRETPK